MGKTRNLFKKIRDTEGTFHAKMGTVKDRNGMDLTEAEILRRGGKNTQNYTKKKDRHDPAPGSFLTRQLFTSGGNVMWQAPLLELQLQH